MAAGADKFLCSERKPLRGAFIRRLGANAAHEVGDNLRMTGVGGHPSGSRGQAGLRPDFRSTIHIFHGGQWCAPPPPWGMTVVFTCNTYSVPYKGKEPKNSLSPKSLNTLIHQCITFYVFLIFQYLSLWKSVFSCN